MNAPYSGGINGNIRYHSQSTLRVGIDEIIVGSYPVPEVNRAVLIFNIQDAINNILSAKSEYTTGNQYSVINARLNLVSSNGKTAGNLYAFMLPLASSVDESVSWQKPTEKSGITLEQWSSGGAVEPLTEGISAKGLWNQTQIEFDITPFVNIWLSSGKPNFGIMITSDETTKEIWEFHSQEAETPLISGAPLTNVRFLGAGDTNTMNTEGIVVKISPQLPYLTIDSSDNSTTGMNRWAAFNASVSIGDTFSMLLPDTGISASVYTLLDKRTTASGDTQFLVSGSVSGFETQKHATAEFVSTGRVESGTGIVEFVSPNNSLKVDLATIVPENTIIFDYKPTITPNNAKAFTVDFVLDETLKNNRSRIYVKEQTASENRNGMSTVMRKSRVRPRLSLNVLI